MLESDLPFDFDMSRGDYDNDDDEDDDNDDNDNDQDTDDSDDSQTGGSGSPLDNAAPHEVEAHRSMIGEALQHLSDEGIDVDEIAEDAGINSSDVDALSNDDLATLTQYVAQNHPEVLQTVSDRFPAAQGLLSSLTGDDGIGGIFRKLI